MRVLVIPVVAVVVLAGVWVSGGVISNDFRTSMALTAVWFAISGAACLLIARRWRPLRVPVIRGRDREEFAPAEPASDGRVLLAAALQQTRADEMAIERLLPERDRDRSIGREL